MKFGGNLDLCYKELQNAVLHNVTSDIDNPLAGQIWYRSDSGEFVFYGKRGREVFISELYLFHTLIPLMDNTYSQIGHSHNLEDLDERSYYSLLDTPGDWDALDAVRGINTGDETAESIIDKIGTDNKIKSDYLPSYVDDVIEGYYFGAAFYSDSAHTELITAEQGKIYVDISTNLSYRYSGSAYINISNPLDYSTNIETDKLSTTKVSAIKTFYDWAVGKFIQLSKIVTTWTATPLDTNIPSEKLVKDSLDLKADITPANGSTSALRALFIARGAVYNGDGTYSLGGLTDITESQMILIYNTTAAIINSYNGMGICCGTAIRTSFMPTILRGSIGCQTMYFMYAYCTNLESIKTDNDYFHNTTNVGSIYLGCVKLHTVDNMFIPGVTSAGNAVNAFGGCAVLVTAKIKALKVNFSFSDSPLLSLDSLQYLVTNRANGTSRITITVHSTVWEKLDDAENYPAWSALLAEAGDNCIDFAMA